MISMPFLIFVFIVCMDIKKIFFNLDKTNLKKNSNGQPFAFRVLNLVIMLFQ